LGIAYYGAGDGDAAHVALERSVELRADGDSYDWFFLAITCWKQGQHEKAGTWFDQAVRWMDKNAPRNPELVCFRAEAATMIKPPDPELTTERAQSPRSR